ncbi:MAG: acetolactate synthase AlsS [Aeriscardovia sp.]|nr:acetolactate synthase AlsS [Aeriscardovia sp.]MBQ5493182.1 acetolactate synthase AlsS [Aeriscardovia sp.]MBQ5556453.1 acetolactate synthase AlsS [Aeriscardovia sp.]MBQ5762432.1 acetolactate synthase AlsS [Aeriscardovia sp.]
MKGSELVVRSLEKAGVKWVFGIPGAKIDALFDALADSSIETVVCRHEQNAAFMAQAIGRMTGTPGVAVATSGPGTSNLATGLLTANTEGDPVIALCGDVPRDMQMKHTHQAFDSLAMLKSVSKGAQKVIDPAQIQEALFNAVRQSLIFPRGAESLVFCQDVLSQEAEGGMPLLLPPLRSAAPEEALHETAEKIRRAKLPVFFVGRRGSCKGAVEALHVILREAPIPVVETFQGSGAVSHDLESLYMGRVGIFGNQPGDEILRQSDCVVTIGYDPVEYDAKLWNCGEGERDLVHIDELPCQVDRDYSPNLEAIGDIEKSLLALAPMLSGYRPRPAAISEAKKVAGELKDRPRPGQAGRVDPVAAVKAIREAVPDSGTVISDVGSVYIYMARHFRSYLPGHLFFSNGQQTLGVALPWAIAASVAGRKPVVSVSGDGGFLFSACELETAVRIGARFVHVVFDDGSYDMVGFQEEMKYQRRSGVNLGAVDIPEFAKSFGALGYVAESPEELKSLVEGSLDSDRPVVIDVPVNYSSNIADLAK